MTRRLPEPTRRLLGRLKYAARGLDRVAGRTESRRAHETAAMWADDIWRAIDRLEDLAAAVEELAPIAELSAMTREE